MPSKPFHFRTAISAAILLGVGTAPADACTRALYTSADGTVVTGRSMDWMEDMHTDLWAFPRGIARDGASGPGSVTWTSRYGSIAAAGYNAGTADGINEAGLVVNVLYLAESDYGTFDAARPHMSISLWGQYALDNFATVAEAVDALQAEPFQVLAPTLPNGSGAQLHLALSDPSGDSAVLEYIGAKLVIHHGKQYVVMTNSPSYDQQLAINQYWQQIGGLVFAPGTNRAADRFARASFLIGAIPKAASPAYFEGLPERQANVRQAITGVMSVIRSVSVPLGITTPGEPNISSTIWRTVADQTHKVYYFDSAVRPNTFWVDVKDVNLAEGAPVLRLKLAHGEVYSGDVAAQFQPTEPFQFLPATH